MSGVPVRAFVGVGANLDNPALQVEQGIEALRSLPQTELVSRSSLYASAPVDAPGPEYVNAAVALRTRLDAAALLGALHAIEARFGRRRSTRHAPRTLDLDLLLYGDACRDEPLLRLPHPRLHQRAFVLQPLLEIAPELRAPGLGALSAYLPQVQHQPIRRLDPEGAPR
jgi:2-amino-4-hydroxy-6-hydroxymethyldihydropteridine diphosphokinase